MNRSLLLSAIFLITEVDYSQEELVILTDEQDHKPTEHRTPFFLLLKRNE